MCDDGPAERRYWIRKMEELWTQMEQEELVRQRQPANAPATPGKAVGQEQTVPVRAALLPPSAF